MEEKIQILKSLKLQIFKVNFSINVTHKKRILIFGSLKLKNKYPPKFHKTENHVV